MEQAFDLVQDCGAEVLHCRDCGPGKLYADAGRHLCALREFAAFQHRGDHIFVLIHDPSCQAGSREEREADGQAFLPLFPAFFFPGYRRFSSLLMDGISRIFSFTRIAVWDILEVLLILYLLYRESGDSEWLLILGCLFVV